jgi:outer membrane lipoprotein SlyB
LATTINSRTPAKSLSPKYIPDLAHRLQEKGAEGQEQEARMHGTRNNPLVIAAAVALLVCSLLGIAAVTGVLPTADSKQEEKIVAAPPAPPAPLIVQKAVAAQKKACATCGVIASVQAIEVKSETSGAGAVAGGVAGAVVGNQFGRGDGRTLMTIAGAAGGALAGNEIEKHVKKQTVYRITVRMDDGRLVKLSHASAPAFAIGERVRVNGNALERG